MTASELSRDDGTVVRILDEYSAVPLYVQLAGELERRIRRGEFRERPQLPSKRELIEQYGVSPATADKATKLLRGRGVVRGVQGKGVFALPLEELPPEAGTGDGR